MNKEKFCLSSDVIEISEEDKSYLEMVNRVCYYGAPNANGVILPAETAEQFASTLVEMPVYAKCRVNENGEPTFGSHEVCIDENGDLFFDTVPIGVHTSVEVKEDTVTIGGVQRTLPCLFATQKIWTRNTNAVAAIKRLFSEGKLHNSWELCNNAYTFQDGLKTITDYEFVGNTLLGYEYADPAYGESAKVLSISSQDQLMVAEALSRDLITQKEEDENLNLNSINSSESVADDPQVVQEPEVVEPEAKVVAEPDTPQQEETAPASAEGNDMTDGEPAPAPETSSLTDFDIRMKIRDEASKLLDQWCWVAFVFPEEHYALLETDQRQDELSYVKVTYLVGDDDTVTVSDPSDVKLVVSVAEINDKIAELNEQIASLQQQFDEAQNEISVLKPYREAAEKAEKEHKQAELRVYMENSHQFTDEEMESEEISALIENVDTAAIKAMIADRVVSSQKNTEQAPAATQRIANASIAESIDPQPDPAAIMRAFFASK